MLVTASGFGSYTVSRGIERSSRYLLLVEWETVEDHTERFRGTERHACWHEVIAILRGPSGGRALRAHGGRHTTDVLLPRAVQY